MTTYVISIHFKIVIVMFFPPHNFFLFLFSPYIISRISILKSYFSITLFHKPPLRSMAQTRSITVKIIPILPTIFLVFLRFQVNISSTILTYFKFFPIPFNRSMIAFNSTPSIRTIIVAFIRFYRN